MPALQGQALKGSTKLAAQLSSLAGLDKSEAGMAGAEVIVVYMQSITPVDTGELRDSEHPEPTENGANIIAEAEHASYVEFGTYKMKAQPFFRPAIDSQQKAALKAVGQNVVAQIKRLVRGA